MPTSALVLTMSRENSTRQRAIAVLREDARLVVGDLQDVRLPVVLETTTVSESISAVRDELLAIVGVEFVDVIHVDFSDLESREERLPPRRRRRDDTGGAR